MSSKKSSIWGIALPISVVFLAAVYYIKVPEVRKAVDAKTPIVHNLLGRWIQETGTKVIVMGGEKDPLFAKDKPPRDAGSVKSVPTPAPVIARGPDPVATPAPTVVPPPGMPSTAATGMDLQTIASNRSRWPKKVTLTKAATFPAVLNGKIVGTLVAPVGAEVTLVQIKDDKVGLEFNGGGAWVPVAETDLLTRVQGKL